MSTQNSLSSNWDSRLIWSTSGQNVFYQKSRVLFDTENNLHDRIMITSTSNFQLHPLPLSLVISFKQSLEIFFKISTCVPFEKDSASVTLGSKGFSFSMIVKLQVEGVQVVDNSLISCPWLKFPCKRSHLWRRISIYDHFSLTTSDNFCVFSIKFPVITILI